MTYLELMRRSTQLPSNFIVSGIKSSRWYFSLILNVIIFSISFTYIFIEALSLTISRFYMIDLNIFWISDIEYDPSGNSYISFHLLFLYDFFIFSMYSTY